MPKVPVLDNTSVAPQQLPGINYQTPYHLLQHDIIGAQELANTGRAITGFGGEMANEVVRQQAEENEAAVKDKHAQLVSAVSTILHDPDSGYMNQQGKNAVDGYQNVQDALTQLPKDMSDGFGNEVQRKMFQQAAAVTINSAISQAQQHAGKQTSVYELDSSKARSAASMDAAVKSFNPMPGADNSIYTQGLTTQKIELENQADKLGLTGDAKDQYIMFGADGKSGTVATYVGVVSHLLENNQTPAAKAYFQQIQGELPAATQDKVRDMLNAGQDKTDALNVALQVKDMKIGNIAAQESELDDMFKAGKITAEVHDMALQKLRADNSQRRAEEGENDKALLGDVWALKQKNPNASLADLTPGQIAYIRTRGLGQHVDAILDKKDGQKSDPAAYFNIVTHMGDGSQLDISKLSDADWYKMGAVLSDHDFKSFSKERANEINGTPSDRNDPGNINVKGYKDALNSRLTTLGINTSPKDTAGKAQLGAMQQYAAEWVLADQKAAGHRFNQEETQKSLDRLFATNVQFRTNYLGGLYKSAPQSQRMMTMKASDIPKDAYNGIKTDLIRSGNATPSDQDILLQYWRLHGKH